jgi:hypothetical protein
MWSDSTGKQPGIVQWGESSQGDKLGMRLIKMLRRYQERWPGELSDLARQLRKVADALDMRGKKRARA